MSRINPLTLTLSRREREFSSFSRRDRFTAETAEVAEITF
jgi:hypothetical protein